MILIIGGLASGKRQFVQTQYNIPGGDIADGVLDDRPVIYNLQDLIAAQIQRGLQADALIPLLLEKQIVICNEVGSGIVPVDKTERAVREATGRVCTALAAEAEKVVRLYCGVPTVIKEQ